MNRTRLINTILMQTDHLVINYNHGPIRVDQPEASRIYYEYLKTRTTSQLEDIYAKHIETPIAVDLMKG